MRPVRDQRLWACASQDLIVTVNEPDGTRTRFEGRVFMITRFTTDGQIEALTLTADDVTPLTDLNNRPPSAALPS